MYQTVSKKNIIIIFAVFLCVILLLGLLFYVNLQKNSSITVDATVKYVRDGYIIVIDDEKQEYSIDTDYEYQVGDRISFVLENVDRTSDPIKGKVIKIDTISKSVQFIISDSLYTDKKNESQQANTEITNKDENADDMVLEYFETLNQKIETYSTDKSLESSIKSGFITVVDFLFYEGEIKGKTFSDLSDSAKIKVLKLVFSIDQKIEAYFPNYKEEISATGSKIYTNVKSKAIELYLETTTTICNNHLELCVTAKEGLTELKNNFSITWSFVKEISGIGVSKLKSWYEVWKDTE